MYSRGITFMRWVSVIVVAGVAGLLFHDLVLARAFVNPSATGSCAVSPTLFSTTNSAVLTTARSGSPFAFKIQYTDPLVSDAEYGYEVWYDPTGLHAVSLLSRDTAGLFVTKNSFQPGSQTAQVSWVIPASYPAGNYTLFPYKLVGASISYSNPLNVRVVSDTNVVTLLPGQYVTSVSQGQVSVVPSMQYVVYLQNPDSKDHTVSLQWSTSDPSIPFHDAVVTSRTVLVPAQSKRMELAQTLNRASFSTMQIKTSVSDSGFRSASTVTLSGTLLPKLIAYPGATASIHNSFGALKYAVDMCVPAPILASNKSLVTIPQSAIITVNDDQFVLDPLTYTDKNVQVTLVRYLIPLRSPLHLTTLLPDQTVATQQVEVKSGLVYYWRLFSAILLLLISVVFLMKTHKRRTKYQEAL